MTDGDRSYWDKHAKNCQRAGYLILLGAAKVIPHSTPPRPC